MDIEVAKFRMYNVCPFLGTIIYNLPVEELDDIDTMGVDGEKLYYNKKFWDSVKTPEQKLGLIAHELGHLFLGHLWRKGSRNEMAINPKTGQTVSIWNMAGDYAINSLILHELFVVHGRKKHRLDSRKYLPEKSLYDSKYIGWSSEKIYEDLIKKIPKMSKKDLQDMIDSMTGNDSKWGKKPDGSEQGPTQKAQAQANMGQLVQRAYEESKSKGSEPAFAKRLFQELEPKENWRKVLEQYIQPYNDDYTFSPVDRRFLETDFMLPDIKEGEKIDWIAVAIDTSGSIGGKEINHFVSEVKAILGSYDKVKIKLTFCDAEASPFVELDEYKPEMIKPVGGGGTDFRPVFNLVAKEQEAPSALVYFTDMYGDFPSKAPGYDTIWISTSDTDKAPFGKVLDYKI